MQNAQNTEIQQRVINLVNLYRIKVGKESEIAKEAKADYDFWEEANSRFAEEDFANGESVSFGVYGTGSHTEIWTIHLMVNEQLIGHFYAKVAGEGADQKVLAHFLPELYDTSIYSDEEENFLTSHFQEMVNYIIQTPCNDLEYVYLDEVKDVDLIPNEVLSLIKSRVNLPTDAVVYNPFAGFGQFACVFKDCHFYCEESYSAFDRELYDFLDKCRETTKETHEKADVDMRWAWLKVALFANNLDAKIIDDSCVPSDYDALMAFIPNLPKSLPESTIGGFAKLSTSPKLISKIQDGYKNLKKGGDMILIVPNKSLWDAEVDKPFGSFWKELIEDHAIVEVIQLPSVMSQNLYDDYCIIIAKKDSNSKSTTMIDARFAEIQAESLDDEKLTDIRVNELLSNIQIDRGKGSVLPNKNFPYVLDINAIEAMIKNEGKELATGLRKMAIIPHSDLKAELLFPQIYVIEKPNEYESPRPLSDLCMPITLQIADACDSIQGKIPWVKSDNLSGTYQGALDTTLIEQIGESIEAKTTITKEMNRWELASLSKDELNSYVFRRCTYVDGKNDAIVFYPTRKGIATALLRSGDTPIAIDKGLFVLQPNRGINTEDLLAIISMPIVWRQMLAYKKFGLNNHLDDILVPTDKRIIQDEIFRIEREQLLYKSLKKEFVKSEKKQKEKLENYQHAMRKHIREISSSVRRMGRFINDMESPVDLKNYLRERLEVIKKHRLFLSDDIERLNEENNYGEAIPFDIDNSLRNFQDYFGSDNYSITYSNEIANEAVKEYNRLHKIELDKMDDSNKRKIINQIKIEESVAFTDIAEYNFGKIVRNILENARTHGFSTNISRNDYKVEILLSWDNDRKMYRIDFRNNGDPLPEGLSKESYGENRKFAGKTGGTGIGGYEVAETVKHYNGDYSITQDGDWVVVSIYLPKSKSNEERL